MRTPTHLAFPFLLLMSWTGLEAQTRDQRTLPPPSVLALLTQVHGHVRVLSSDRSREIPARVRQALAEDDRLELGDGARVTLLCANATVRRLRESAAVTPELCVPAARGSPPAASGLELHLGSLQLVGEARGKSREDFDRRPVIVSPRCPADVGVRLGCFRLLGRVPLLRWLEVAGAERYHLELAGSSRYPRITVSAVEASCSELGKLDGRRMCSLTWPVESWSMKERHSYQLSIVAVGESKSRRSSKTLLWPLPVADAEKVHRALDALSGLELDHPTENLTRAAIYAGSGLVNEAVRVLESAAGESGHPVLILALGDAYRGIDLPEFALSSYQSALVAAGDALDLRGEAELGLGRVLDLLGDHSAALHHLRAARHLLGHAGLIQEAAAAATALADVYERRGEKQRARALRQRVKDSLPKRRNRRAAGGRDSR